MKEKEKSEFKPVKLRLKIDLVSYPARADGVGKYGVLNLSRDTVSVFWASPREWTFFKVNLKILLEMF